MLVLYNLAVSIYHLAIRMFAPFSEKAKLWVNGRKDIFSKMSAAMVKDASVVWIHCASLGEFEQGRPVIEGIKAQFPRHQIFLTFFSPSGFEIRKDYSHANHVFYLPGDSAKNAQQFLEIVKPEIAIFVKYEFWYHYLNELQKLKIPTYLISAIFRQEQTFFKPYGSLFRKMLVSFEHIFVQNKVSEQLLQQLNYKQVSIAGDTRIDRVIDIASQAKSFPLIEQFCGDAPIFIVGSSWAPDEQIILSQLELLLSQGYKIIFAPHETKDSNIHRLEQLSKGKSIRYSSMQENFAEQAILIIDNIGMLSSIYRYGKIAYIGGGFGTGIHNTLEPAAFGLPIIFGPKHEKFEEAKQLLKMGGAFCIKDQQEFGTALKTLFESTSYQKAATASANYLEQNKGATEIILQLLQQKLD